MKREKETGIRRKSKDLVAFACMYDRIAPGLWGLILKFTPDDRVAEEILEESFLEIWTRLEESDPAKTRLSGWMAILVIRQCVRRLHLSRADLLGRLKQLIPSKQVGSYGK